MQHFEIYKDYWGSGVNLFKKSDITINEGITVLVGCNGSGKTTLMDMMTSSLKKQKIPFVNFNNLHDGGRNALSSAGFHSDIWKMALLMSSSEGESIYWNLGPIMKKFGELVSKNPNADGYWIFFDAIDSGFSIDNIIEVKTFLHKIIDDNPEKHFYMIISANEYEMCNGEQCFDVTEGVYITFNDYGDFRKMIIKSRRKKDVRMAKLDAKEKSKEEL
jgi:energy-coupling factor transporter ATP-binding protein EcfA2